MSIEVRLSVTDLLYGAVDSALQKAGIPPLGIRDGLLKQWYESGGSVIVFQYIPRAETMIEGTADETGVAS